MLVVAGSVRIDPARREEALRAALAMMEATRREAGCRAYTFSADLADPGRFRRQRAKIYIGRTQGWIFPNRVGGPLDYNNWRQLLHHERPRLRPQPEARRRGAPPCDEPHGRHDGEPKSAPVRPCPRDDAIR
jgi:hypothetical protein